MHHETARFIELLSGSLEGIETFQTFADSEAATGPVQIWHGKPSQLWESLSVANEKGCCVAILVNQGDGKGRRRENILGIRALFVDCDEGELPAKLGNLPPSILVQSRNGQHAYWLLKEGEDPDRFSNAQKHLIRALGTDPSVHDMSRVMRLPGSVHMKTPDMPFHVGILKSNNQRFTIDEVLKAFPLPEEQAKSSEPKEPKTDEEKRDDQSADERPVSWHEFLSWANGIDASEGHRHRVLVSVVSEGLGAGFNRVELESFVGSFCERTKLPAEEGAKILDDLEVRHAAKSFESNLAKKKWSRFENRSDGLYCQGKEDMFRIGDHLEVVATTRDQEGMSWGRLVRFYDRDGKTHELTLDMARLCSEPQAALAELASRGYVFSAQAHSKTLVIDYIMNETAMESRRCITRTGWTSDGLFVLPDQIYGKADEIVVYQPKAHLDLPFATRGTLQEWQENVGKYCAKNSRLAFAVSTALAGSVLHLLGEENGGVHFRGSSSSGKTTALFVAGSALGGGGSSGYIRRWRATDNAIEILASGFNDFCLILDELGQVEPRYAGEVSYMLSNGAGKARATKFLGAREIKTFRLTFLSAGEISLEFHMAAAGKTIRAGQEVRLADVPADAGAGLGLFSDLHGFEQPAEFADYLRRASCSFYGTPGRAWVSWLVENTEEAKDLLSSTKEAILSEWNLPAENGQVQRVAGRFALIGATGELALKLGILPWKAGEATAAARACFEAWFEGRGAAGDLEVDRGIEEVRSFLIVNDMRFQLLAPPPYRGEEESALLSSLISNRAGYKKMEANANGEKEPLWYILPEVFKREVCRGRDHRQVLKALADNKLLKLDSQGGYSCPVRIPGAGSPIRMHVVQAAILTYEPQRNARNGVTSAVEAGGES